MGAGMRRSGTRGVAMKGMKKEKAETEKSKTKCESRKVFSTQMEFPKQFWGI